MKDKSKISTLRTTVFEAQYSEAMYRSNPTGFKCIECGFVRSGRIWTGDEKSWGWKFCPGCGAEIMRFARDPEREPERTETEVVDQDGRPVTTVTVESEKPKERFIEIEVCSPKQPAKMLTVPIVYEEPSSPKMARSRSARR